MKFARLVRLGIPALLFWTVAPTAVHAQAVPADSVRADSLLTFTAAPIVVTATRTDKSLAEVALPVTAIPAATLREQGLLRLDAVLASIPGLALVDDHGTGLQMQGLSPEYTLIMIDGEPVIGRTAGTLDLRRLSIHDLERIEIVRGPASSLYGSEALAGVVNLITATAQAPALAGRVRAGSYGSTDLVANAATGGSRSGIRLMVNRNASGGYDLAPEAYGATVGSFVRYTASVRGRFRAAPHTRLTLGSRMSVEDQSNAFAINADGEDEAFSEAAQALDWSVHPEAAVRLGGGLQLTSTIYVTGYRTRLRQRRDADGALHHADDYHQILVKAEAQLDAAWTAVQLTTLGSGLTRERLHGDRYDTRPDALAGYAFLRHEWHMSDAMHVSASARYDTHADYAARLSPNAALFWRVSDQVQVRMSVGSGFKAPALRQRYLAFTNASTGYSVFGATRVRDGLLRLQAEGRLKQVFIDLEAPSTIAAESSIGLNAGFTWQLRHWAVVTGNLFHNGVRDLIETQPIAQKTNGSFVYGYFNLARIYTRGVECQILIAPMPMSGDRGFTVRLGYQFLQARDLAIVRAIRRGDVFGRQPSGRDVRLRLSDYDGLFGRSPHMATMAASLSLGPRGPSLSLRGRWRSRYGYRDLDGNKIANRPDEFVDSYAVMDMSITQPLGWREAALQAGIDNVFSVTRPRQVPSLPGRRLWVSLNVKF